MSGLVPCPECNRHVRRSETECPFCGRGVQAAIAATPERAMPTTRLSRSALAAFAAVSVGAASCSSTDTPVYGAPAPITGGATGMSGAAGMGAGGELPVPFYGSAPFAGGFTGAGGTSSAGASGAPHSGGTAGTSKDAGDADAADKDAAPLGAGGSFRTLYGGPP